MADTGLEEYMRRQGRSEADTARITVDMVQDALDLLRDNGVPECEVMNSANRRAINYANRYNTLVSASVANPGMVFRLPSEPTLGISSGMTITNGNVYSRYG